jgi:hypothetical protein
VAAPTDLRPRTVGELLDASFHVYRRCFGPLLLAVTVLSLPTLLVAVLLSKPAGAAFDGYLASGFDYVRQSAQSHGKPSKEMMAALERYLDSSVSVWLYSSISTALQALSRGGACVAGALVAWAAVRREPLPGAWTLVRRSLPHVAAATGVQFLVALVYLLSGACCFLLPVSLTAIAVFAPACAVIAIERPAEGRRGIGAVVQAFAAGVGRSCRMSFHGATIARGTFFTTLLLTFVTAVVGVVALAAGVAVKSYGVPYVLNHWAEVLFLPVIGIGYALWYVDLRVRREGADFEESA